MLTLGPHSTASSLGLYICFTQFTSWALFPNELTFRLMCSKQGKCAKQWGAVGYQEQDQTLL